MDIQVDKGKIKLVDGKKTLSWIEYEEGNGGDGEDRGSGEIHLIATFTAKGEERKGYASKVVEEGLKFAEKYEKVKVSCPYIKKWIERHGYIGNFEFTLLLNFKEEIEKFNRYHSPEATAEYVRHEKNRVVVKFYGPFCHSCGVYDYFEDLLQDVDAIIERL
jgi:predicted GNAT family acetyltransferase